MPPKVGGTTRSLNSNNSSSTNPFHEPHDALLQQQWVNVTWMPHTALSQSSHVCLTIHSAHVVLLNEDGTLVHSGTTGSTIENMEWRIQMSIHGIGNLPLAPISTYTKAATVTKRTRDRLPSSTEAAAAAAASSRRIITIQKATHECHWDCFAYMPLRWRDLTRDSFLLIEVIRSATTEIDDESTIVYHTTIPFFTNYGKLVTGLQKLRLHRGSWSDPTNRNYGLILDRNIKEERNNTEDDPVWKSVLILEQLELMENAERSVQVEPNHTNGNRPMSNNTLHPKSHKNNTVHTDHGYFVNNNTFGRIPSVPWLDAMMKERARQEIQDAFCVDTAVRTCVTNSEMISFFVFVT